MDTRINQHPEMPKIKIIDQLNEWIYKVCIFRAALELQLWAKVAEGEYTPEQIATRENWDPLGTRMLLDDICSLKLLEKKDNHYHIVPEAEYYLLPDKPTYQGKFLLSEFHWEGNGLLAEAIRTGKRPIHHDATTDQVIDTWIAMYAYSWAAPESYLEKSGALWQALGIVGHDGLKVLDVACGVAPRSLALARNHICVRVTLLDWERILQMARKLSVRLGVDRQVATLAGDLWVMDWGFDQYNVVFMGDIIHFYGPEENIRLFRKAYDALMSGGIIVVDSIRRENPDPLSPGLWFYATSPCGALYDFDEYRGMLENAGFKDVEDINRQPIKAIKP
jgi:SAM-dependent methyltransferase